MDIAYLLGRNFDICSNIFEQKNIVLISTLKHTDSVADSRPLTKHVWDLEFNCHHCLEKQLLSS